MSDKESVNICLIDSNIWLYILLPGQDVNKAEISKALVRQEEANIIISTQIVNEVVSGIIKNAVMSEREIREFVHRFYVRFTVKTITEFIQLQASRLRERYSLSYWDSLIVSTALQSGVTVLYSEDMHNGLVVADQLTIVNPFVSRR